MFLRLNLLSSLYALVLVIQFIPILNVYRINRILSLPYHSIEVFSILFNIIILISSTYLFYRVTKKFFPLSKAKYILIVTWIPYFVLLYNLHWKLFPITFGGDKPAPITGLLMIAAAIGYPLYIAIINYFSPLE